MKLRSILYIGFIAMALCIGACSSSGGDDDNPPPPTGGNDDEPMIPAPGAATLVFPEDQTECNTGIVDPNDATMSTVTFEWNASTNTDRYTVTLTNLNSGTTSSVNANTNEADITIMRGAPYSWSVTSRADGTQDVGTSATFRFYNEGPGIENYAPFPAEVVSPARGANIAATTMVTLSWTGSDIDDDITGYEVFFGTEADPTTSVGTTTDTTLTDMIVMSGTTYFWRVVTTDSAGNTSSSEVFSFKVG
ncbi:hypothetical protein ABV409_07145 [Flagellimonas sp. DF-77]|uniref:fibronectin type III domain-containing protein n=1 Tax=Flagellimonas algarum TaxID=3230298 RepID=UPI003395A5D4